MPNLVSNHLTTGLLQYIRTSGRYASGINLFEKLRSREPEISALLAQVFVSADEEVQAVRLLHDTIQELPMDHALLDTQASFCHMKGRNDLALDLAKRSVIAAPSEFSTWARLAEIYISLEQWDYALLTLNSCPMFTYQDKDAPRNTQPDRVHLPIMPESSCDEIDETSSSDADMVHPSLRKLVAAGFKGTFQKAYALLTEVTKKIGWDQLLRIRSQVFVMEEEYRTERTGSTTKVSRSASTTALNGGADESVENSDSGSQSPAPSGEGGLSKPGHTITPQAAVAGTDSKAANDDTADPSHTEYAAFRNKRLCERWLDNLFMILYEDLRIYTIWRTEMSQYKAQQMTYKKSPEEWEILGELSERLHYDKEAVEAYQQCLGLKFSPRAMKGVMQSWQKEGDVRNVIGAVIRLICWQYRWYSEVSCRSFRMWSSC